MAKIPQRPIEIVRGDTYSHEIRVKDSAGTSPVNITGRTYTAQIRPAQDSATLLASFTCTITDGANGILTLSLAAVTTAAIAADHAYYDVQELNSGVTTTILGGPVTFVGDVTQ